MMNLHEIPSIEGQTFTFIQLARALNMKASSEILEWQGFKVRITLLTDTGFSYEGQVTAFTEAIVLNEVLVPEALRRKGWFSIYCELCKLLTKDAVILIKPQNPYIVECLQRRGFYWYPEDMWIYRRAEEAGSKSE